MAITSTITSASTLGTEFWDLIKEIVSEDSSVSSTITNGYVGDAYPQEFLNDASKRLPLVIIHRPKITEEFLTMKKKKFNISVQIECVADTSAKAKQLSDEVRNALQAEKNSTKAQKLFNFMITSHDERFELRDNKRVHFDILTVSYVWLGGGVL
jgi:hypothetical protein